MQGMHDECANSDFLGQAGGAQDGILKQVCAESFAMVAPVYGQTGKYHDRNGIGHVASNGAGRGGMVDGPGCQRVVGAYDMRVIRNHEGSRCARRLIAQGAAFQPVIHDGLATVKRRYIVFGA